VSANHAGLAHHFENLEQQHEAATLGMWLFLATELLIFGGLFLGYTVYRLAYPNEWAAASHALVVEIGAINTIVLLTSSLTMALGVRAAQVGNRRQLLVCLGLTALLGATFLGIKAYEYYVDYTERLVPNLAFEARDWAQGGEHAPADPHISLDPAKVQLFFMFYYIMTGIHAVHLIIGIALMLVLMLLARRDLFSPLYYDPIEVGGLYWHFVDVIWIFLLPLLYLVASRSVGH
jgi:cytochrome c oxidase subunit III